MLTTSESLLVHSVEGFLTPAEIAEVAERMSAIVRDEGLAAFDRDRRTSVHVVDGLTTEEAARLYEPAGRVEVADLPAEVLAVLEQAGERALPHLRRLFPSGARLGSWVYLEYGLGQFITPHVDLAVDDAALDTYKVAGIGFPLNDDYTGGEFYVETCGGEELWQPLGTAGMARVREGADESSDWYPALARTRWTVRPAPGTAVMYGSQLSHGTLPVAGGRIKKIIGFFTS